MPAPSASDHARPATGAKCDRPNSARPKLVLFDLDHTLLDGDSDALWVELLCDTVLPAVEAAALRSADADIQARYRQGRCDAHEFCAFYLGTIARLDPAAALALRARWFAERVAPRLYPQALDLIEAHRAAGDVLVLTSATSRFLCEPTAAHLGLAQALIATEAEADATSGRLTGRVAGTPNMRAGKIERLQTWLADRAWVPARDFAATRAYSDSINDLPLLQWADEAIVVNPDPQLAAHALAQSWQQLQFRQAHASRPAPAGASLA